MEHIIQIVNKAFLILFHADAKEHVLINFTKLIRVRAIFLHSRYPHFHKFISA